MNRILDDARKLISTGKSKEAIIFLIKAIKDNIFCDKEYLDQLVLLSSRLENVEITIRKGIISHADANLNKSRIIDDLLRLISSDPLLKVNNNDKKLSKNTSTNLPVKKPIDETTNTINNVSGEKNILIQGSKGGVFNITNQ